MPEIFENAIRLRKKVAMTFLSMDEAQVITSVYIPLKFGVQAWHYDKKTQFYHCLIADESGMERTIYLRHKQVRHIAILEETFNLV